MMSVIESANAGTHDYTHTQRSVSNRRTLYSFYVVCDTQRTVPERVRTDTDRCERYEKKIH
ncbi:ORF10 [Leucania separata nucleopolyhedrovirus]|uniref:ORF10 n=1 Tax=Leucania separata nucleopolyhedrovirus TaxID=1307956 RepID=Q0ILA9_NPVLS|nr:ORF10 [Leucania separata nucleopolyhedrovirus]AAR28774.1 ORF10 [Leucania separata nucleopolyhedrovirus]